MTRLSKHTYLKAVLCLCAGISALLLTVSGASAAVKSSSHHPTARRLHSRSHPALSYDPTTQSHPGACSQTTLNVAHAVHDLNLNGVLGKYAARVGVHASGNALIRDMDHTLVVIRLAKTVVADNHGCTTDGVIFPWGKRTLRRGETVGVALSAKVRKSLCRKTHKGCARETITVHTVFPTNCWNVDAAAVKFVVYVHKKHVKPTPPPPPPPRPAKKAIPSATASLACSTVSNGGGTLAVQLSDAAAATMAASFSVSATGNSSSGYGPTTIGPVAAGTTETVLIAVDATGDPVTVTIGSGKKQLFHQTFTGCPEQDEG